MLTVGLRPKKAAAHLRASSAKAQLPDFRLKLALLRAAAVLTPGA
jgi:hypothetical protein